MKEIRFEGKYGQKLAVSDVKENHSLYDQAKKKRDSLIQRIANYDDAIGELYLNQQKISVPMLKNAVRRMLNNPNVFDKISPVFLGASLRNQGVQPLLDAIVDYLPSPTQRPNVVSSLDNTMSRRPVKAQSLSAFTFKVLSDRELGSLAYTRVYSGFMSKNSNVLNSSRGVTEKSNYLIIKYKLFTE